MPDPTLLTCERLRELLHYDPDTGSFTWLVTRGKARPGMRASYVSANGYMYIGIERRRWLAHRLAWLYMTGEHPPRMIDHKDNEPTNLRWSNLRLATNAENGQNQQRPPRHNTSGFLGVSLYKPNGKYAAYIKINGKSRYLGYFESPEQAHDAYVKAKREMHPFGML